MRGMSFQPRNRNSTSYLREYDGGIGSGILSPALSASGGSTTVTPLTPMTPLTTPRTPLQILLQSGVGGPYRRSSIPQQQQQLVQDGTTTALVADNEEDQYREKQLLALQLFANFLNTAETTLNDISERESSGQRVLGPGIVRVCQDLADEIEGVARELHKQQLRASEHLDRVRSDHDLRLIEEGGNSHVDYGTEEKVSPEMTLATLTHSESISSLQSHEEYITSLTTTHTLLLDMAAALRAISQQEAQELGEVALDVARMFVWSLNQAHGNLIQMTLTNDSHHSESSDGQGIEDDLRVKTAVMTSSKQHRVTWSTKNIKSNNNLGPVVEILGEGDENVLNRPAKGPSNAKASLRYTPQLSPIPSSPEKISRPTIGDPSHIGTSAERVRVLWPPLLPVVAEASKHCANSAREHPVPAIAIGLACGPAAVVTAAFAGPPLLVADWAIQQSYDALSEHTPIIENVEKGAANALQVAKLAVLCSKLVVKQGISVGERQIERRGGVGKICEDVAGGAKDMALHPVETAGAAIHGLWWMGGAVRDAAGWVKDTVQGGELGIDMH